jgi:hypothetical protein
MHHESGNHDKATKSTTEAYGHALHGIETQKEGVKISPTKA